MTSQTEFVTICKTAKEIALKNALVLLPVLVLAACTHKVQVETKEPITINLNVKVDHEIRVKVDKELDDLFADDSNIF